MCQSEVCSSRMAGTYVGVLTELPRLAVTDRSHIAHGPGVTPAPRPGRATSVGHRAVAGATVVPPLLATDVLAALLRPAVGVLLDHVIQQLLDAVGVRDPPQDGDAALAGRLDAQRAAVDDPPPQAL